ncbi:hypothetical protein [Salinifilum ghardaiensis]
MRTLDLITWCAAGVAIIAVTLAWWHVRRAHKQAQQVAQQASRVSQLTTAAEDHAEQSSKAVQRAQSQAERAWEQVKFANEQLEQARQEHRASARAELWEWAYALTKASGELVEASQELLRIAFDPHVAPHYRLSTDRHYRQACQRWQDTAFKAVARASPPLEQQSQIITFADVHHRLHGQIEVVLRAAETGTLAGDTALAQQVFKLQQELGSAHRQLQRTVSAHLSTAEDQTPEDQTQHVTGAQVGTPAPNGASARTSAMMSGAHRQSAAADGSRAPSAGTTGTV